MKQSDKDRPKEFFVLALFAITLFVSATLLFLVQPMVGKMILPSLGGTPAVWNTCMVFFQGVLLVGYAYTHALSSLQDRRRQILLQGGLLLLPLLVLPFTLGSWTPPAEANPVLNVLWLLLGMVGLPFFVVSTSAPLLQRWFSNTDHPSARDPYFLYGASNLGSMLALLLYPLAVEPLLGLEDQTWVWTAGYVLFAALVGACAFVVWSKFKPLPQGDEPPVPAVPPVVAPAQAITAKPARGRGFARAVEPTAPAAVTPNPASKPLTPWRRLRWIGLAAVPSSMMLGMTTFLTTDIAAIPFFWVLPLAMYLLTFILVFARWPVIWSERPHDFVLYLQPAALLVLVMVLVGNLSLGIMASFLVHSAAFFLTALMCHGELARDRPEPSHLTEFYLWLSVGGVVGGLFNALLAPLLFRAESFEYPIAMIAACLLRPSLLTQDTLFPGDSNAAEKTTLGRVLDFLLPVGVAILTLVALNYAGEMGRRSLWLAGPVMVVLALMCRPLRFGLGLAALFFVVFRHDLAASPYLFQERGFFGFVKVREDIEETTFQGRTVVAKYRTLVHGGINHGMQIEDPARRREPITYFHPTSGIGQVFERMKWHDTRLPASLVALGGDPFSALVDLHSEPPYAVVGLGIGTLASHARPLQTVDIYEIDPLIRRLSVPENDDEEPLFYYVQDAVFRGAAVNILMGDGRLVMKREGPESYYHVLVLDAFSSDAIPVHLLTAEALDLYLEKLAPGGALVFNTTNRYVDIQPVLADLAASRGLGCYSFAVGGSDGPDRYPSDWVVLQRPEDFRFSTGKDRWQVVRPTGRRLWTDRYSNLLSVISW